MKTTLKIGMLAAVAALALAGCNNAIPTEPAADSFAYNADQYYRNETEGLFTVKSITSPATGYTKTGEKRLHPIVVEFSHPVTKEAVMKGVKCYKLTPVANSYSMPGQAPADITDVRVDSMGTKAYLTVKTDEIDHLYVSVTASDMHAVNGALLNADGDDVWGEKGDDDYAAYIDVQRSATSPIGNFNYKKETLDPNGEGLNKTLWHESNPSRNVFAALHVVNGLSTSDSAYMGKTLELPTSTFVSRFLVSSVSEKDVLDRFANVVLNEHLRLEQYDWENARWDNVTVKFAMDNTKNAWVSTINVTPNRKLRARLINADQIQLTGLKRFGYPIRAHLKHNGPKTIVLTSDLDTGYLSLKEGYNWSATDLKWTLASNSSNTNKTIEITLKPDSLGLMDNVFVNNKWVKVTAANKDTAKASFFAGFDYTTVTKDNFKCFIDKDGKRPLVIKDITVVPSTERNNPKAFDKIIISSEDNIAETEYVYISPKVMTASFMGSYLDGSTRKGYMVPKLCFAQTEPSDDPEELYGWRKITKN